MQRRKFYFIMYEILLLACLLLQNVFQLATSASTVEYLPGFEGPLPFHLETGYVGVGESEESEEDGQVFYYFVESENNPEEDPLMLWLTGGPGCSGMSSIIDEIGPFTFKVEEYNGGMPNLTYRPQTWTKACSIIFIDLPLGTGFSYPNNSTATLEQLSDGKFIHHAHQFLRKWMIDHPRFLPNQFYVGGESFTGIVVPPLVQEISNANEKGIQPWINLQGYVLGNPLTTGEEENYLVPFSHGMGLISDELYMSLQKNCKGDYINTDSRSPLCERDFNHFSEVLEGLYLFSTLEPDCSKKISPRPCEFNATRTCYFLPPLSCKSYSTFISKYWANNDKVREALSVRKGTTRYWDSCVLVFNVWYKHEIPSSFQYHVNLSRKGYRSLIYSGDHDGICPFMSTQAWIRNLNYSIVDDWRPWLANGQVAGYTRSYSNNMTFVTIKGGGHNTPLYNHEECFVMFNRWISNKTL